MTATLSIFGGSKPKRCFRNGEPRSCALCGAAFRPQTSKLGKGPRYGTTCSPACRNRQQARLRNERGQARVLAALLEEQGLSSPILGARIGLSADQTRDHLQALQGAGRVRPRDRRLVFGHPARGKGWWLT